MPFNKKYFFLAATATELALLLGNGPFPTLVIEPTLLIPHFEAVKCHTVGRGLAPQLCTAHPRGPSQNISIGASKGMICPDLGEIGFGRGRGFSPVAFPTPLLFVLTFRFGGIYLFGAFGVATLATGVRVGEGFIDRGDAVPVAV